MQIPEKKKKKKKCLNIYCKAQEGLYAKHPPKN